VALDAFIHEVGGELRGGELSAVIDAQHLVLAATFLFSYCLHLLDGNCSSILGSRRTTHMNRVPSSMSSM